MSIYMWREYVAPVIDYLCFTANTASSTVQLNKAWSPYSVTLETSTDGSTRTTYTIGSAITLSNIWDKVYWRNTSETTAKFSSSASDYYRFWATWSLQVSWDVTSLINKNCTDTLDWNYTFCRLFATNANNNHDWFTSCPKIPATTLTGYCYYQMFRNCTWLTTATELPATTLMGSCYYEMFRYCPNLEQLPKLPTLTLTANCYTGMFRNCSKIKISSSQTWEYQTAYRIPTTGTGTSTSSSLTYMFSWTWWTYTSSPSINTTYYTSNTLV